MQSHHRKVVAWLTATADPPIPVEAAWKVLETGRERFKLARSRCANSRATGGLLPGGGLSKARLASSGSDDQDFVTSCRCKDPTCRLLWLYGLEWIS